MTNKAFQSCLLRPDNKLQRTKPLKSHEKVFRVQSFGASERASSRVVPKLLLALSLSPKLLIGKGFVIYGITLRFASQQLGRKR
jgi:hypothetical protein